MASLTDAQKSEVVRMLARFHKPAVVIRYFREEHGLDLTHKQVGAYDPTRNYYEAGDKWRQIFEAAREAYLKNVTAVPIANKAYRLNRLDEMARKAHREGKLALAAQLLAQAAKEAGGLLTSQREVRIEDGRPPKPRDMTPEDRRAALAEVLRQVVEQREAIEAAEGTSFQ